MEAMNYRLENIPRLSDQEMLKKLRAAAKLYEPYADQAIAFVFRKNKDAEYGYYIVQFGKRNFMHLAGVKSKTLSANDFYNACLLGTVKKEDCTPRRNPMTMYAKIDIMGSLLDFKNSKCYKIGDKTTVTADNDFEFATGNNDGLIGYDHRINVRSSDKIDRERPAIPTTLLRKPLYEYCLHPQKIIFVLKQNCETKKFDSILYEIKKGLFLQEKKHLPDMFH